MRGSYALEVMFKDYPNEIYVARKDSPMIIGIADGETYVASDVPAILNYTRNVYYIGDSECGWVFHCQRGGLCMLYFSRTRDFRSDHC